MSKFINIPLMEAIRILPAETERLKFRRFDYEDASFLYELNLDKDVIQYTGDEAFQSVKSAEDFLEDYDKYEKFGFGRWVVMDKITGEKLGWCGLTVNEEALIDIGFRFFKKFWGMGYATESAQSCMEFGFNQLGISKIIGRVAKENKASIRVLEKLGMTFWKHGPCGHIDSALYYSIDRETFSNQE